MSDLPPAAETVITGELEKPVVETPQPPAPETKPPVTEQAPKPGAPSQTPAKKKVIRRRGWTPFHELYESED